MTVCRTCQAPVLWARHMVSDRPMPIDLESVPQGNIRLLDNDRYQVLAGDRLARARTQGENLHLSHFVTCPNSRSHRRT